jgi:hypothetical protein
MRLGGTMNIARTLGLGVLLLSLGLVFVACGGDSLSAAERQELKAELMADGLSEREADCFIDELGGDAKRLWEMDDEEDMSERDFAKLLEAFIKCVDG